MSSPARSSASATSAGGQGAVAAATPASLTEIFLLPLSHRAHLPSHDRKAEAARRNLPILLQPALIPPPSFSFSVKFASLRIFLFPSLFIILESSAPFFLCCDYFSDSIRSLGIPALKSELVASLQKEVKSLDEDSWSFARTRSHKFTFISRPGTLDFFCQLCLSCIQTQATTLISASLSGRIPG
ncbi:uncharacterized protein LOC103714582 [Phoenix dactylifera]|uniref:Uncharacterized protein LOC103714582 n=1 Tax=Phoenix dactylifera TaxID=42345 RepID=A0A8B8ZEX3_PHODC|nr:uncharacterized protein LOC103714582 [Phoenix dactylifera]